MAHRKYEIKEDNSNLFYESSCCVHDDDEDLDEHEPNMMVHTGNYRSQHDSSNTNNSKKHLVFS